MIINNKINLLDIFICYVLLFPIPIIIWLFELTESVVSDKFKVSGISDAILRGKDADLLQVAQDKKKKHSGVEYK